MPSAPRNPKALAVAVVALVLPLGACGGGDDDNRRKSRPKPEPTPAITEAQVNALPLDTPRTEVERMFGAPFDPKGVVPGRTIADEPEGLTCTYHRVQGGAPNDFFQFCYKNGRLGSKLSLVTAKGGGAALGGAGAAAPLPPE